MKRSILKLALFGSLITLTIPQFAEDYKKEIQEEGLPIINSTDEKDILPGGFRMSKVIALPGQNLPNLEGLDTLNISGSSQFSELSLDALVKRIGKKHITVVNLRQEDGGFLEPQQGKGAIAFSYLMSMPWWTGENPKGNRTVEDIEISENRKMAEITKKRVFTVYGTSDSYAPKDSHEILYKIDIAVKRAFTEKTLAEQKGLGYYRLPDKKFGNMQYEHVDDFVDFVTHLPPDEWIHFHCKKGQSRTTLFMIMYDMMRNADKVSAEDIIKRQGTAGLGGADLFDIPETTKWDHDFKMGWREFLIQFHTYAKENKASHFSKSWTDWAKKNGIAPPPPVVLDKFYKAPTVQSYLPSDDKVYKEKILVLNTLNESKLAVSNFRTTQDLWAAPEHNPEGLSSYYASGSNQYTKAGLELLLNKLKKRSPKVVVVDLRHDDHLFINGLNVSTFETKEALLKPRSPENIKASEKEFKKSLEGYKAIEIHGIDTKYPKNVFDDRFTLTLQPKTIETPEEVVTKLGADYLLIGSKRFSEVADEDLDRFIAYYNTMPSDTWYHFHCKKGKSRTTFFMVILDTMKHADKLSMKDIVSRQKTIGGIDLFDITPKDPTWKNEKESKKQWIAFLARFHKYCQDNKDKSFSQTWSDWSKQHADYKPNIDSLVYDTTKYKD